MINRNGILKVRIVLLYVAALAILLVAGTTFPKFLSKNTSTDNQAVGTAAVQPIPIQGSALEAASGRDLFMGYTHFQNDGPPCMGCHSVGENGLLGGGAMGPDLTNISTRRSQAEISSILSNTGPAASPVMQPIFTEHPLTESEKADLVAFLTESVGQPETNREIIVIGISLAGFVAAVLVLGFMYRNRLRGVRRALVERAQAENR